MTADDQGLRTALRNHLHLLGAEGIVLDDVDSAPVRDEDGRVVRVDLLLSRLIPTRENHREHLVVELKRPSVHIGLAEVQQIITYADAVSSEARFDQARSKWSFWIVGDEIDRSAESLTKQKGRDSGVIHEPRDRNLVVRAVTWAAIIQDARHRLKFVRDALDLESSGGEGMDYLRRVHAQHLPDSAVDAPG